MIRPSLADYGTHGESAFPRYWDRVLRAWSPVLGQTGGRVYDFSRNSRWGLTTGIDLATQWGTFRGNTGLSHDGVDDWVDFGSNDFSGTDFSIVSWFRVLTAVIHFPYSTSNATGASGVELLYGVGGNLGQIASRIAGSATAQLAHDFGSSANALADAICFVQTFSDSQTTKAHGIFVNGANAQTTTYTSNTAPSQNWSWAKRGTFFVSGTGSTVQWFEQMVFRGIITANEAAEIYQLGPGGLYQRRKRRYSIAAEEAPAFRAPWATRSRSIIGGGIR
jgi:hypothetical protein